MPDVIVLAGPNGAGKSTASEKLLQESCHVSEFVNADVIARGLSAFHPEGVAVAAGRIMLTRLRELAAERKSFAFETTLASRTFAPWLKGLIESGYVLKVFFFWLPNAEMAVQRVAQRFKSGGHTVAEDAIRRRYDRGLDNLFESYLPMAGDWFVYDSSTRQGLEIARGGPGMQCLIADPAKWQQMTAGRLS